MGSDAFRFMLAAAAVRQRTFPTERLFAAFRTPQGILQAKPDELRQVEGLTPGCFRALREAGEGDGLQEKLGVWKGLGIRMESYESPRFPESLRHIPDPPPVVFLCGDIRPEDRRCIAVVGSRRASAYGISACRALVSGLVGQGFTVVSGMARGIDASAHWTALESGGRTVGVLGTGVDVVYPKSNRPLFQRVPCQGAILSEFLPGTGARPENFPRRNRLIAGLAWGVLVVEAAERSGTMITVRLALEQGREVFAVPGDVRSAVSRGTNRLIQQGAKLVVGVEDILEEFEHLAPVRNEVVPCTADIADGGHDEDASSTLLQWIDDTGIGIDDLLGRTGWSAARMNACLAELELVGKLKRLPGNRYVRVE